MSHLLLVVLSIGWAACSFHPVPDLVLTQHYTTVNLFGLLTFDPFFVFGLFFSQPCVGGQWVTVQKTLWLGCLCEHENCLAAKDN